MTAALILLWLLFGGSHHTTPKCPSLLPFETIPIYEQGDMYGITVEGIVIKYEKVNGIWKSPPTATTTFIGGEPYVQIGERLNLEAIEFNKRVRECQTANGEFKNLLNKEIYK